MKPSTSKSTHPRPIFPWLWGTILLHIVLHPLLGPFGAWGRYCLGFTESLLLGILVVVALRLRTRPAVCVPFAILVFVLTWGDLFAPAVVSGFLAQISRVVFYMLVLKHIFLSVVYSKDRSADVLHGVVCLYLLIGLTWATLYSLLNDLLPNAFVGIESSSDFTYFSFVTLTSLGYGDVRPLHSVCRVLAGLEATSGVLFSVLFVARMVIYLDYSPSRGENGL